MKNLKIILGVLALILVFFFGSGLIRPTVAYENEIVVNKPANEVWVVMADPSKMAEWLTGFIRMEHVSGLPGMVGSVSNVYFDENGEEMMIKETIVKNVPGQEMAMLFEMDFMKMDYEVFLNETDGKTSIVSKSKAEGNGLFAKSILSFMKGSMLAQEEENLSKLKGVIER